MSETRKIKAVFIDVDDTLLDFAPTCEAALKAGFEKFALGEYKDEALDHFLNVTSEMWREIERGYIGYGELREQRFNRVFERIGISFDGRIFENFFAAFLFESAIEVSGATELLDYLYGKYVLCTASNGPYAQQINRLKNADMLKYFDFNFISENIGASKPSKEFFSRALSVLNAGREEKILPCEVIMIGDSLSSDMTGGIESGLKTCFVDRKGIKNTGTLSVDHTVRKLKDIAEIL